SGVQTISILRRTLRYVLIGSLGLGVASYAAYEGAQQYVERVCLAAPSRANPEDEYGWQDEYQGWTGGQAGGTDPRLGRQARSALRGAWLGQQYGAGTGIDAISTGGNLSLHPEEAALKGMIGSTSNPHRVDRGLQLAENYLDLAIGQAQARGIVFPDALSVARPVGPTTSTAEADPTAVDLLMLKAGVLERISTPESLDEAKELYETVFATSQDTTRALRMAGKVGDVCVRLGQADEALVWWKWGLQRVGLDLPKQEKGWFKTTTSSVITPPTLSPAELRATISLLASAESHYATTSQLDQAAAIEEIALRMLPPAHPIPNPSNGTAGATLHDAWLQQRAALFTLHQASVSHALGKASLDIAATANERAGIVIAALDPLPSAFTSRATPLTPVAQNLRRDALLTGAEASYIHGLLIERSSKGPQLAVSAQCFQRAMNLSALESGRKEEGLMGEDWQRYSNAFARVNRKL
ncbi:hypothetical protein BCR39DRAFT_455209, partial [Naematelia encephala]